MMIPAFEFDLRGEAYFHEGLAPFLFNSPLNSWVLVWLRIAINATFLSINTERSPACRDYWWMNRRYGNSSWIEKIELAQNVKRKCMFAVTASEIS
jgi:uncharacterized membrane protein YkgB